MNRIIKDTGIKIRKVFSERYKRRMLYLLILVILGGADFLKNGLVRRTLMFYAISQGTEMVEDRFFPRSGSKETDIRRYVEEVLLGPAAPGSLPLFPREARLESLLYREERVYVGFSESAALPPLEGGNVFNNLRVLRSGILRNFPCIKEVKFFINGNEILGG
jgi:spore germination protein GerM